MSKPTDYRPYEPPEPEELKVARELAEAMDKIDALESELSHSRQRNGELMAERDDMRAVVEAARWLSDEPYRDVAWDKLRAALSTLQGEEQMSADEVAAGLSLKAKLEEEVRTLRTRAETAEAERDAMRAELRRIYDDARDTLQHGGPLDAEIELCRIDDRLWNYFGDAALSTKEG